MRRSVISAGSGYHLCQPISSALSCAPPDLHLPAGIDHPCRCNQSRWVQSTAKAGKRFNQRHPDLSHRHFVHHGGQDDGCLIARSSDLFVQLLLRLGHYIPVIELRCPINPILRPDQRGHPIGRAQHRFIVRITRQLQIVTPQPFGPTYDRLRFLVYVGSARAIKSVCTPQNRARKD
jgi:hypothetical protein